MRLAKAFLIVVAAIAVGCTPKPTDKLVGTWKVDPASIPAGVDTSKMTINMKADKTFASGDGQTGTYTLTDQAITFTQSASKAAAGTPAGSMQATLSADGASFSVNIPGARAMVFKKADS